MDKFTKEQALAVMGFTGYATMPFAEFHADVQSRLGRPVWTHEFADEEFAKGVVKQLYRTDFLALCI